MRITKEMAKELLKEMKTAISYNGYSLKDYVIVLRNNELHLEILVDQTPLINVRDTRALLGDLETHKLRNTLTRYTELFPGAFLNFLESKGKHRIADVKSECEKFKKKLSIIDDLLNKIISYDLRPLTEDLELTDDVLDYIDLVCNEFNLQFNNRSRVFYSEDLHYLNSLSISKDKVKLLKSIERYLGKTPVIYDYYNSRDKDVEVLASQINATSVLRRIPILAITNPLLTASGNIVEVLYRIDSVASRADKARKSIEQYDLN